MQTNTDLLLKALGFVESGKYREAEDLYELILSKSPGDFIAMAQLGSLYGMIKKYGIAIPLLKQAIDLMPDELAETKSDALVNLCGMLRAAGHNEVALRAASDALKANPNQPAAYTNLAAAYVNAGNPVEGEKLARKALALRPGDIEATSNLGFCLLEQGKWKEAWEAFESRLKLPPSQMRGNRNYDAPYWNGQDTGTLVVHGEQGLGDEILYLTMLPELRHRCKRLVVEANGRLRALLRRSLDCEVYATDDEVKRYVEHIDAVIPMGSLGRFCRNSSEDFARSKPYLKADAARVSYYRKRMDACGKGPYIALAWQGGSRFTHADIRNPPLDYFADLIQDAHATFISCQYTKGADFQAALWGLPHWQEAIDDLDEQAALIAACDMTISVAQTALHISGALGKPTLGLINSKPAWRYQLSGEKMLWYPCVKIIRQSGDDWSGVFRKAINEINNNQRQLQAA